MNRPVQTLLDLPQCGPTEPVSVGAGHGHARKRGRGATEVVAFTWTTPRANPRGRRRLTFRFRVLRRHERPLGGDERAAWVVASDLLKEYFASLGGFATVSTAIMRAWADLLLPSQDKPGGGVQYTPDELRSAIAAKATAQQGKTADETARKRAFLGHVATFPERLGYWLDLAQRAERKRPLAGGDEDLRERLNGIRRPVASSVARRIPVSVVADAAMSRRAAFERHLSDALVRLDFNRRVWHATQPDRQSLIERALRADFSEYLRVYEATADPNDARFGSLWLCWRVDEVIRRHGLPAEADGRAGGQASDLFPFMGGTAAAGGTCMAGLTSSAAAVNQRSIERPSRRV